MTITIKSWIYEKVQGEAFGKGKTIVWKKEATYDSEYNVVPCYTIKYDSVVKETEKAICLNCCYWYHGNRRVSFQEYTGYKVWIPKSAIVSYDERGCMV